MKIHQVKTRLVNSYIIEYPDTLLVMDVAVRCHRYVLGFIETELKRSIHDVSLVICSHDDPDHMGGVKALATLSQAEIALPEASGNRLTKIINNPAGPIITFGTMIGETFRPRAWRMYFNPERDLAAREKPKYQGGPDLQQDVHGQDYKTIKPDYRLNHDTKLPGFPDWSVIHTPGHSWDSCCYYHAASGSLLSGDMLLGSNKHGALVTASIYANPRQSQQSLAKLRCLDIKTVYPGHGRIFSGENIIPC